MPARQPTKHEIEIKLRIDDLSKTLTDLRRLGARPRGRVFERNTVYDTPDRTLYSRGRLLRLRVEEPAATNQFSGGAGRAILTSKSPPSSAGTTSARKGRYKERLEREALVRDERLWPAILHSLGFRPGFQYEKYRTSFRLPGLHLDLDETPVGTFLELEGAPKAIDRVARALGFSPRDYIRDTYWGLYAEYCRRHGHAPRNMVLPTKKSS
jgi:adenylate cyclase class 2